jgi:tetratricopeptide (TPR) repeat protein
VRGHLAAALAEFALSHCANVHRIDQAKDWGLDFYCELRLKEQPYLPFFVQCKGHTQPASRRDISFRPKAATLRYWLKQRSPVYVIAVDLRTDRARTEGAPCSYWSATEELADLHRRLAQRPTSLTIHVSRARQLTGNDRFFEEQVILDHIRCCVAQGFVPPIPQLEETYVRETLYETQVLAAHETRIKEVARQNLYALGLLQRKRKEFENAVAYFREAYRVDRLPPGDRHFQYPEALGVTYLGLGDRAGGLRYLREALEVIANDPKVQKDARFQAKQRELARLIAQNECEGSEQDSTPDH